MDKVKNMQLSLNGETFSALKEHFDSILDRTLKNMENKGADEATITLKLAISLEEISNPGAADDSEKEMIKPTFKHDISSIMQVKSKMSGSLAGDYQLVWDEDTGKYVMKRITNGQMNLFDGEGEDDVEHYEPEVVSGPALIEGGTDDDVVEVVDAEYIEGEGTEVEEGTATPKDAFEWLCQFKGQTLNITEAMGNYAVRTDDNKIVLTSASKQDHIFHCDADILAKHIGHSVVCAAYGDDDNVEQISIECEDCFETLFTLVRPDLAGPDLDENDDEKTPVPVEDDDEEGELVCDVTVADGDDDVSDKDGDYEYVEPEEDNF